MNDVLFIILVSLAKTIGLIFLVILPMVSYTVLASSVMCRVRGSLVTGFSASGAPIALSSSCSIVSSGAGRPAAAFFLAFSRGRLRRSITFLSAGKSGRNVSQIPCQRSQIDARW